MHSFKTLIATDPDSAPPPTLDAVADALLQMAVRDHAIDQQEATELLNWDLGTIAQFLALRLCEFGFLSNQEVTDILATHTPEPCH